MHFSFLLLKSTGSFSSLRRPSGNIFRDPTIIIFLEYLLTNYCKMCRKQLHLVKILLLLCNIISHFYCIKVTFFVN